MKKQIGRLILRGPLLQKWCDAKTARLEDKLRQHTVAMAARPLPAPLPSKRRAGNPLRKIVFIADILWEANELIPELEKICPVETLDVHSALRGIDGEYRRVVVARTLEAFLRQPRGQEPDLVFLYLRANLLSEEVFSLLRGKWSCPVIGLNLDDKVSFWDYNVFSSGDDNYRQWAPFFDLNITNSQIGADWYRQHDLPVVYAAQGVHHPAGLTLPTKASFAHSVAFLGAKKLDRAAVVEELERKGIPVTVFGSGWRGSQWVDDANAIFRSTQINLGIGSATLNYTTIKGRDFECPGVGACYLTTYNWELAQWWDIGREILCYRNLDEAIEIIAYYKNRPEECLQIAQAAFRRAEREHTWQKRYRQIFKEIGFTNME